MQTYTAVEIECQNCGKRLPQFGPDGRHNFSFSSRHPGNKIRQVCMKCKMEELDRDRGRA